MSGEAQWFVECSPTSNESLAEVLAAYGLSIENVYHGLRDVEGKSRDVWLIPSEFVHRLRNSMLQDRRYTFRFFVRNSSSGPLHSGDFLMKRRRTNKVKVMAEKIAQIKK